MSTWRSWETSCTHSTEKSHDLQQISRKTASDKAYQLLAHGRWFSPGTLASSTTKTGRHDIAEILLKVALNTKNYISEYF
jgi:hypothetical protein